MMFRSISKLICILNQDGPIHADKIVYEKDVAAINVELYPDQ